MRKFSHWSHFDSVFLNGESAFSYVGGEQQLHPCSWYVWRRITEVSISSLLVKAFTLEAFARICTIKKKNGAMVMGSVLVLLRGWLEGPSD